MQSSDEEPQMILIDSVVAKGETVVFTGSKTAPKSVRAHGDSLLVKMFVSLDQGITWNDCKVNKSKVLMIQPESGKKRSNNVEKALRDAVGKLNFDEALVVTVPAGNWEMALPQIATAALGFDVVIINDGEHVWGWGWDSTVSAMDEIRTKTGAAVVGYVFGAEEERILFGARDADVCIEVLKAPKGFSLKIDRRGSKPLTVAA